MRYRDWAAVGTALVVLAAAVLALVAGVGAGILGTALAALVGIVGVCWSSYRVLRRSGGGVPSIQPPERSPERSRRAATVSGRDLLDPLEAATGAIRGADDLERAAERVRPVLRATLIEVYEASGADRATAERDLAAGAWTDDSTAAALLDPAVEPPARPLSVRIERWLFPERVFRRRVNRAVDAIVHTAEDRLPTVAGQTAPRPVPITDPPLAELRRTVDGRLEPAGAQFGGRSE
ncbi:DUF7269 family protein [Halococcoides cellulosivorans]|uniref:Uncharacterized protein n=1 Tax=Halococcoides cellulosivorans TaxID=1679096 RepID=A0A2R4X2V0_9EURY|nr:hypothetical protein [Halococcoides cellulosivorans]AWB28139.1 hypothetical protein HARCEL1_10700 [Halococcoides cellulosivorans]